MKKRILPCKSELNLDAIVNTNPTELNIQYINNDFTTQSFSGHQQAKENLGFDSNSECSTDTSVTTEFIKMQNILLSSEGCERSCNASTSSDRNTTDTHSSETSMSEIESRSTGGAEENISYGRSRVPTNFFTGTNNGDDLLKDDLNTPPYVPRIIKPPSFEPVEIEDTGAVVRYEEKDLREMGFNTNTVVDWERIVQPQKSNLYTLLRRMIDNHYKPNIQVIVGSVVFNCHLLVLQAYSDFFMHCHRDMVINIPESKMTPKAFVMVYDWMLADNPIIQREGLLDLFNAAYLLRIRGLIDQCWICLDDDKRFREDTAFMLYLEARKFHLCALEELMLTRICKFFLTLVSSKDYLLLNAREVCILLSSNTIGVNSETEIFMAAIRWLSFNWEERSPHTLDVARCVRYGLLPPWFLISLTKNTDCSHVNAIVQHPVVADLIKSGIAYNTAQLFYCQHRQEYLVFLERYGLLTPVHRQWVYDPKCKYHSKKRSPSFKYFSYRDFLDYLEMIQNNSTDYWESLEMLRGKKVNYPQVRSMARAVAKNFNDLVKNAEGNN